MKLIFIFLLCLVSYSSFSQNYLVFPDARGAATSPLDYSQKLIANFKNRTDVNLPVTTGEGNSGTTVPIIGIRGWRNDNTAGKAHELVFSDDNFLYVRSGWSTWENWRRIITEDLNGNVGIGTLKPGTYKLAVNGAIHAKQVNVDLNNWADYVFTKEYNLPTLKEVATYIKQNQHLPDVPSEKEIKEKGLNVGEMMRTQMKKLEELTLYMIEKDKELAAERLTNKRLEARIRALEKKQKHSCRDF